MQESKSLPIFVLSNNQIQIIMKQELRVVEVTYKGGNVITTSMAAHLTDEQIKTYFKVGKVFNIGSVEDDMRAVEKVKIIY